MQAAYRLPASIRIRRGEIRPRARFRAPAATVATPRPQPTAVVDRRPALPLRRRLSIPRCAQRNSISASIRWGRSSGRSSPGHRVRSRRWRARTSRSIPTQAAIGAGNIKLAALPSPSATPRALRGVEGCTGRAARRCRRCRVKTKRGGQTIAPKGEVTGVGQRPMTPAERLGSRRGEPRQGRRSAWPRRSISRRAAKPCAARSRSPRWCSTAPSPATIPNTVCGVVYQNSHRHLACQFTFACDGIPDRDPRARHVGAREGHRGRNARRQAVAARGRQGHALPRLLGAPGMGARR